MLQYITLSNTWENLSLGDYITFNIPNDFDCIYVIDKMGSTRYFCKDIKGFQNRLIFNKLGIDAEKFIADIVDYTVTGQWPQVKTLNDLKKVIKALDDECIKKWGMPNKNTSQFKIGDKVKILDRKGSSTKYFPVYTDSMLKYVGRLAMITLVNQHGCQIDLDNGVHYWPFEVLQLVTSAKQLDSIGLVDISTNDLRVQPIELSSLCTSCLTNYIQRVDTIEEPQTETELNLFPKKKHYQLNFNY